MTRDANIEAVYPLSPAQQGILFHLLMEEETGSYLRQMTWALPGDVDPEALRRAWQRILERHPILRTAFVWKNQEEPLQVVRRQVSLPWEEQDWRGMDEDRQKESLDLLLASQRRRGFDLTRAPLLRLTLLRTRDDGFFLVWSYPQLLLDGWSRLLVQREVLACYQAFLERREPELPPARPYRDHIAWLRRQDLAKAEAYWRHELAGFRAPTPLPGKGPKEIRKAADGSERLRLALSAGLTEALRSLARRGRMTLNTLVQGAWALLLARYSGRADVLFGLTVSGRPADLPGIEGMVGQFVNTLPLRIRISSEHTLLPWLQALQAQQAEMRDHEYAPLVRILGWSEIPAGEPLFESVTTFQNHPGSDEGEPGAEGAGTGSLEQLQSFEQTGFALDLTAVPGRELVLDLGFDPCRFEGGTVQRLLMHLRNLLEAFVAHPERRVVDLPLLSPREEHQLLAEWNDTGLPPAEGSLLHELFEVQAARAPEATAVLAGDRQVSYGELDRRANRLARRLRELGAGPESLVAVVVERSPEMLLGFLAALKAGAAFLPLDPSYPDERLRGVLGDAAPSVLLARGGLADRLASVGASVLRVEDLEREISGRSDAPLGLPVPPDSLAYAIYTSGSSGRPKGVLVSHGSVVSYVHAVSRRLAISPRDRILQFASPGFDVVIEEVFPAWSQGAAVVLGAPELAVSSAGLLEAIHRHQLTALELPAAYWHEWMDALAVSGALPPASLRLLILGCEQPSARRLSAWQAFGIPVVNIFGLTETTVTSSLCELAPEEPIDPETFVMAVGRPIAGARLYVAGPGFVPVPAGAPAELLIGGAGLARGYLNRPDLTAERFIPDPFGPEEGARLYRTGDLARWRPDGELEFLGRLDEQVKIRGFRVELGEIEAQLLRHPGVRQAAAAVREDSPGDRRLVAYVVPGERGADVSAWRDFLRERLPAYMVPSAFVVLPALPLTPHGKIDRGSLLAPDLAVALPAGDESPRTPVEQMLADLWSQVLGVERIGRHDDFFALGGHSLLAMRLISRVRAAFGVELPLRSLFESVTLAALTRNLEAALRAGEGHERPRIERVPRDGDLPLSFAQQRLWFLDQLEPGSPFYNVAYALRAAGPLETNVFSAALGEVIRRHEVLRTTFPTVNGEARVHIAPAAALELPVIDLRSLPVEAKERGVRSLAVAESGRPFDLSADALLRIRLVRTDDLEHLVLLTMHHVATDEWSMGILVREVAELYRAFLEGRPSPLPELPIQYVDYAAWQRQWMRGEVLERELAYWRRRLSGAAPVLALPTDRPRPAVQTYRGTRLSWSAGQALTAALRRVSRAEGATLFMTLLAAFQALLARTAGQDYVCVGSPIAGRHHPETEGLIGIFVNTLVLRADLSGEPSFRALLAQVRETALGAYTHQDLPFEKLVDELQPERDLSHSPLFQVLFTLENAAPEALELPDLSLTGLAVEDPVAKFDLLFSLAETPSGLGGSLAYNTDLFDGVTAIRLLDRFNALLERMAARPELPLPQLLSLSERERHQLLVEWNDTLAARPADRCLHQLFEDRAERTPEAVAVVFEDAVLTYGELEQNANQLARHLLGLGVGRDEPVAICAHRSLELVVGLLGILKAGAAYLPLDPESPRERLAFLVRDALRGSRAPVVLCQGELADFLPCDGARILRIDADWPEIARNSAARPAVDLSPDHLAYVIYTSGSTGQPKGVMNTHRGIVNRLLWMQETCRLGEGDRVLQKTPYTFDVSVWELFWPLLSGARLVLARPGGHRDGAYLVDLIERQRVTTTHFVPPMLGAFLEEPDLERCSTLRLVICSGEALPFAVEQRCLERLPALLLNFYGPTEAAIDVTAWNCRKDEGRSGVPIGRPGANVSLYVLGPDRTPAPLGAAGELAIGGVQVARGYLNRPGLTAERFVPDPFGGVPGVRLYRTGDRVRLLPQGDIEFLGRLDHQVKIRGFRIELGEIEATLRRHRAVRETVVAVHAEGVGAKHLVAYVVPADPKALNLDELRRFLSEQLPEPMVPGVFVTLAALPLSSNGKVDRKALPAPSPRRDFEPSFVPPGTEVERRLAAIWCEVLGLERVGIHANFFELGGDSILSIQIVSRARQAGLHLTTKEVFQHQTLAELAQKARSAPAAVAEQGVVIGEVPLTAVGHWFLDLELSDPNHFNQSLLLQVRQRIEERRLRQALPVLMRHHDALRLRLASDGAGWRQWIAGPEAEAPLFAADLSALPDARQRAAVESLSQQVQRSLDLARGPVLRVALFDLGPERPQRLLLVIHHWAVDGVSWRILLEDLATAYALAGGQSVRLPAKTTSFKEWSERLSSHARSGTLAAERDLWLDPRRQRVPALPVRRQGRMAPDPVKVALSVAETQALLQQVPAAYRTRIDDALLAALARALARWTGGRSVLVDLEGHGREDLFEGVDLSRTVGWFTSIYPVLLELPPDGGPGEWLKSVKEQLRALPLRGIGYGLLRYLSAETETVERLRSQPCPEVLFNYLGQIDQALSESSPFAPAPELKGDSQGPGEKATHLLDVGAAVAGRRLEMTWSYCEVLDAATVRHLAESCLAALRDLIAHCLSPEAGGFTPSDFPLSGLDLGVLERLLGADRNVEDLYPLSPMQQGLLFHALYEPGSEAYFEQVSLRLEGSLDPTRFRQAWQEVLYRHSILRTSFLWEGLDRPLQKVEKTVELPWEESDWRDLPEAEREARLQAFLAEDRRRGFDPIRAPLMRVSLIRWSDRVWQLTWSHHHLLLDGWCLGLIFQEVQALYDGRGAALPRVRPYRDYIEWLLRQDLAAAEAHWREALHGFSSPTSLGLTPAAPGAAEEGAAGEISMALTAASTARLSGLARRHQLTLNTVVQAAWAILLARFSGDRDVVFGAVVSGRPAELEGIESMMGLFINTLPVRVEVDPGRALLGWMGQLLQRQIELRQYEYSPLAQIQAWSGVPAGAPLFDSLLAFENLPVAEAVRDPEATLRIAGLYASERTHYPVSVKAAPGPRLPVEIQFDRRRLGETAAVRMLERLRCVLEEMGSRPESRIGELSSLPESERHQILLEWNAGGPEPLGEACLHDLFSARAAETPHATAVVCGDAALTYGELERVSNRLAHRLRRLGVGPEVPVALCLERSLEMIVGVLGVLKAGGLYVPLDPAYPRERLDWILEDARPPVLLTQGDFEASSLQEESEARPVSGARPGNAAYVIYTSGSTGQPKGVVVTHRNVARLFAATQAWFGFGPQDVWTLFHSYAFDFSVWEIWGALLYGGRLVVVPYWVSRSPEEFVRLLRRERVTVLNQTPSAFRALLQLEEAFGPDDLRVVVFGGEALEPGMLSPWFARRGESAPRLVDMYGITETTVHVTYGALSSPAAAGIGRPIPDLQVYLLDRDLQPVPLGLAGEIHVGGAGLSRGYLGRPALTAERFVPDPFGACGGRLYRSGDLGRLREDGTLEFLGRRDHQVKIRGFRIELGEIEAALRNHPDIRQAVVLARSGPGGGRLGAWFVYEPFAVRPPTAEELREFLRQTLPDYMVPSFFMALEAFPLTPSGKVSRRALPEPGQDVEPSPAESRTMVEEMLAGIWADVLGVSQVGLHDDFFELGGHSLLATQVVSRVRQVFQVELPVRGLFERPTVAGLAQSLAESRAGVTAPRIVPLSREAHRFRITSVERGRIELTLGTSAGEEAFVFPASFAQQRLWFLDQMDPGSTAYNILLPLRLEGDLNLSALHATLGEVIRRHEVLRTWFATLDGDLVQVVEPACGLAAPLVDLSGLAAAEREEELRRLARCEAGRLFDLSRGPLLRIALLRLGAREHAALFSIHHIVSDAWSMGLLVREVGQLYAAFSSGLPSPLPELAVQYADYAHWQQGWLQGPVLEAHLSFWKRLLSGELPLLRLSDPARALRGAQGRREVFRLSADLSASLRALSRREGSTLFMTLLAGFHLLLNRWSGETDILVGTAIANRNRAETENLIGFFVNMIVLRADLSKNPAFRELLAAVREQALGAYAYQDLPFEKLVEELSSERGQRGAPLFRVAFGLDNAPAESLELPGLALRPIPLDEEITRYELTLWMADSPQGLSASWSYRSGSFEPAAIARMHQIFESILHAVVLDPGVRLDDLDLAGPDDRALRSEQAKAREQAKRQKLQTVKPKAVKIGGAA